MSIQDSEALDQLHHHLKQWNDSRNALTDEEINSVGGPDETQMGEMDISPEAYAASLRRGREARQPAGNMASSPRAAVAQMAMGAAPQPKPPADLTKPLGAPPMPAPAPQEDTELRGLQDKAASDRRMGEFGKSVTAFTERPTHELDAIQQLGGVTPSRRGHNPLWDNAGAEGEQAIADLQARRKSEGEMAAGAASKANAADRKDPNSSTAQTYRAVLLKFAPDLAEKLAGANAEQMEKIAPWLESYAKNSKPPAPAHPQHEDPLGQPKLDETIRHNKAMETRPHGQHGQPAQRTPVTKGSLESIADPGERETVRAIVEGRAAAPAPGSKFGQHIMGLVAQIDPNFDSSKFGAYQHARTEQSTNNTINAAKAVTHHMELLEQSIAELPDDTFDSPRLNKMGQALHSAIGSEKYTDMQTKAKIVGAELAQALGEKDVEGRAMVQHLVRPEQTKKQWAVSLPALKALRDEKLGVYAETLGKLGPQKIGGESGAVEMHKRGFAPQMVPANEVAEAMREGWAK